MEIDSLSRELETLVSSINEYLENSIDANFTSGGMAILQ